MSDQPKRYALVITVVGTFEDQHPMGAFITRALSALEPALRAEPGFTPAWPPAVVSHAELMDDLPLGWRPAPGEGPQS